VTDEIPQSRAPRRHPVEFYLTFALLLALAPAALLAVSWAAVAAGLSDWRGGLGLFALSWAPRLALVGVVSGTLALVAALLAGFHRYWGRALMILTITAVTLGAYVGASLHAARSVAPT
jgi:fatty-acyl-CoA synthase